MKKGTLLITILILISSLFSSCSSITDGQGPDNILYVKADAEGNCSSWEKACDLSTALDSAEAGGEIWVSAGIHKPKWDPVITWESYSFQLKEGVAIYGGFTGVEAERDQRDWSANLTLLSGDLEGDDLSNANGVVENPENIQGFNSVAVVIIGEVTENTRLDGFVITAGDGIGYKGGGLYNKGGSPTLENLIFIGNRATNGGGLYNEGGSPTLKDVAFHSNTADWGGGIYNDKGSPVLSKVTFSGNSAEWGGGMVTMGGSPRLTDCVFSGNKATTGGGMYTDFLARPNLVNVSFSLNVADEMGAGMYSNHSFPTLINSIFYSNVAQVGGGMLNAMESKPVLINVTFAKNVAQRGGGMSNAFNSNPNLINVILWDNRGQGDTAQIQSTDVSQAIIAHSLVQGSGGSGDQWNTSLGVDAGGNLDADPLFLDAATSCILHCDLHLKPGSPAIDAGDNNAIPAEILTDLDGNPRISGDTVDMGAYELGE